jgi:prevent-host-death family protein
MITTYSVKEAQANLSKLCRSAERFVITNRNQPVVVAIPIDDFEALMETLNILEDSSATQAIHESKQGLTNYQPLDLNEENFGIKDRVL